MPQPITSEIRLFPWGVVPPGWARCDGQILPIRGNEGLFRLLGDVFGGDGVSNFGLPDLRGRVAIGSGVHPRAARGGDETHALNAGEIPQHTHVPQASPRGGDISIAGNTVLAAEAFWARGGGRTTLLPKSIGQAGSGQAHDNMAPFLALNPCIALQGEFP
jgi:microcystin-dependent protein